MLPQGPVSRMTLLSTDLLDLPCIAKIPNKISDSPDNLKKFKTPVKKDDTHNAKSLVTLNLIF